MSVYTNPASGASEHAHRYVAAVVDLLGTRDPFDVLRRTPDELGELIHGLSLEQLGRPETSGKWSIRHLLQHLADAELVSGYRFRLALAQDRPPLTGYDQDLFAQRLHYEQSDAREALQEFRQFRRANLALLARTSAEERCRVAVHAERGEQSVEQMVHLNAGNDLLHLRQIERIRGVIAR